MSNFQRGIYRPLADMVPIHNLADKDPEERSRAPLLVVIVLVMLSAFAGVVWPAYDVVIPVFNKEPHVERAIRSALSQTLSPSNILVVDDASTDGSAEKIASLFHPTITTLRRPTPGPGGYAARNLAIEAASTEWIAFLDADDAWVPTHLQSIADAITRNGDDPAMGCVFTATERATRTGAAYLTASLGRLDVRATGGWTSLNS